MKKTLAFLLLALLLLPTLAACGDEESDIPYGMKLASNPDAVDYSLYVPKDWEITMANGATMAQASLADSTSVIVTNHTNTQFAAMSDAKDTLSAYYNGTESAEGYKDKLIGLFDTVTDAEGNLTSSLVLVQEPANITLKKGESNVAALKVVYTATLDGASIQQVLVMAYEDDYFYNITFTTSPALYEDNETTFETILENFNFNG